MVILYMLSGQLYIIYIYIYIYIYILIKYQQSVITVKSVDSIAIIWRLNELILIDCDMMALSCDTTLELSQ